MARPLLRLRLLQRQSGQARIFCASPPSCDHRFHPSLLSMSSRAAAAPESSIRMSPDTGFAPAGNESAHRFLPFLIVLFIGSGCAALIYEIVWFQMLSLIVGSSALSLGVILGTFMGGMCIGSIWLSRVISRRHHPLRVYAMLEGGIAVFGLLEWALLPHVSGFYSTLSLPGMPGLFLRAVFCVIALLPP